MSRDKIKIDVLPDGTISAETDAISGQNHMNAEEFLDYLAELMGGEVKRKKRDRGRLHTHKKTGIAHTH